MTDEQPSQPLTGCELDDIEGRWLRYVALRDPDSMETSVHDVPDLLAEVDRLRAENAAFKTKCDGFQKMMNSAVSAGVTIDGERLDAIRGMDRLKAERGDMLTDLHWYISDLGPDHWQNCDVGDEDCYLCAGHVAIRDRWKGVE